MKQRTLPTGIISAEERANRIKQAAEELEKQEAQDAARRKERQELAATKARQEEDAFIEKQMSLIPDGETREHLLERIRRLREEVPPEINFRAPHITPRMQEQTNLEMEAGRAAVARAQARVDENKGLRERLAAEEEAKLGHMEPVYVPNPTTDEKFPVNKATIK